MPAEAGKSNARHEAEALRKPATRRGLRPLRAGAARWLRTASAARKPEAQVLMLRILYPDGLMP